MRPLQDDKIIGDEADRDDHHSEHSQPQWIALARELLPLDFMV